VLITAGLLSLLRLRPTGGAAMTAFNVAIGLGVSGGLLTGGYFTTELGWRAVFWFSAVVGFVLLGGSLAARAQPTADREKREKRDEHRSSTGAPRTAAVAAVTANLLVFVNYSVWIVGLPLLAVRRFGLNAGEIGMLLFFVNGVHLLGAVPVGRVIATSGAVRALALGFGIGSIGLLVAPLAPSVPWLLGPIALYAIGQVAGSSSAGDLVLRLGGGGGRAVGAVRLSSDIGLVVGPAAVGALADASGVDAVFVVLGSTALLAMVVATLLGRRRAVQAGRQRG
jgi:predicted MFS family arabinose efflux permease